MTVSIENLINVSIQPGNRFGTVENLIQEILILRERLNNPEKQSFYFRLGIKVHKDRLTELEETYDSMRKTVNSHSIDDFQEELIHAQEEYKKISRKRYVGTIHQIALAGIQARINEIENMLDAKAKFGRLKFLDEYSVYELKGFFE